MSKRSQWTDYDKETRKYIKKRDKDKCIKCGAKGGLQIAHIFMSRAHGGKGCKENGVLLCVNCHKIVDNPIGSNQCNLQKEYIDFCKNYLIEKECIVLDKEFYSMLQYKKEIERIEIDLSPKVYKTRCKTCKFLVKNKYNSTIPSYYCKYRHILINKQTEACKYYK